MTKIAYFCIASVCLLLFGALSHVSYGLYATTDPWPMWRYDPTRSSYTTSAAPNSNRTIWTTPSIYPQSTPIVVEGKVIVCSNNYKMYAFDETTGIEVWRSIQLTGTMNSNPAYSDGRIYVGTSSGYLYCIDSMTGTKIWENQLTSSGEVRSSPVVAGGKVFVGTTDNALFTLNASTGIAIPGWYFTAGGQIRSSPAVSGNMIYFACNDGKIYALDMSNPAGFTLAWRYTTKGPVTSTPTVAGGKVFVGSDYNDHAIFALNATTANSNGQLIWKYTFDTQTDVDTAPAFYNDIVYVGFYGKIYALFANAPSGNYTENSPIIKKWSQTLTTYSTVKSPALADGKIFTSCSDRLYALDMNDGHVVWFSRFSPGYNPDAPIVADGRVFVTNYYGVICFGNYYPPLTYYYTVTPPGHTYVIKLVIANATPGDTIDVRLLTTQKKINFTVYGIDNTLGMCNITIPNEMLDGTYDVRINGGLPRPDPGLIVTHINSTHTSLYFTYSQSTNYILVTGTSAIPEIPTTTILSLLFMASLITAIMLRKKENLLRR